jgi:hypothetical protein
MSADEWVAHDKQPQVPIREAHCRSLPLTSTPAINPSFPCPAEHTMPILRNSSRLD